MFQLYTSDQDGKRLKDIYFIRNLIAHSNGILEFARGANKNRIKSIVERDNDLSVNTGTLIINERYLQQSYIFIEEFVSYLISRMRQQWNTKKSPNQALQRTQSLSRLQR